MKKRSNHLHVTIKHHWQIHLHTTINSKQSKMKSVYIFVALFIFFLAVLGGKYIITKLPLSQVTIYIRLTIINMQSRRRRQEPTRSSNAWRNTAGTQVPRSVTLSSSPRCVVKTAGVSKVLKAVNARRNTKANLSSVFATTAKTIRYISRNHTPLIITV